ncbi:unnamed protein product [Dracunculus medinensis]|uniref:Uncharacterized protein n=1 Tax=Dracunculus medinensis TaxID=318479 RepID=A0A0N4UAV0_DRAME|nr:unnamed protein product [Dracunculus medinensis]
MNHYAVLLGSCSHPDMRIIGSTSNLSQIDELECMPGPSGIKQHPLIYHQLSNSTSNIQELIQINEANKYFLGGLCYGQLLESAHSLSYLELVHEEQTKRMRTRSEWFLSPVSPKSSDNVWKSKSSGLECQEHCQTTKESGLTSSSNCLSRKISDCETCMERKPLEIMLDEEEHAISRCQIRAIFERQTSDCNIPTQLHRSFGGAARKRSWRIHYVRPNKSLDLDDLKKNNNGTDSNHSTPLYRHQKFKFESGISPVVQWRSSFVVGHSAAKQTNKLLRIRAVAKSLHSFDGLV